VSSDFGVPLAQNAKKKLRPPRSAYRCERGEAAGAGAEARAVNFRSFTNNRTLKDPDAAQFIAPH